MSFQAMEIEIPYYQNKFSLRPSFITPLLLCWPHQLPCNRCGLPRFPNPCSLQCYYDKKAKVVENLKFAMDEDELNAECIRGKS